MLQGGRPWLQLPTMSTTLSGLTPPRAWAAMGLKLPMASITSRACRVTCTGRTALAGDSAHRRRTHWHDAPDGSSTRSLHRHRLCVGSAAKLTDLSAADAHLSLAAWLLCGHAELCALPPSAACSCVGLLRCGKLQRHAIRMNGGFLEAKPLQQSAAGQNEWCLSSLQTLQYVLRSL